MAIASSKALSRTGGAPGARAPETARRKAAEHVARLLGHRFENGALLDQALTHASASGPGTPANERFEFLGDRVLGLLTADALLRRFPDAPEGDLAARFNALVRKETCAEMAEKIGVGAALRLGRSESRGGGRKKEALLADAMEALIAAVYLDGGLAAAAQTHAMLWGPAIDAQTARPAPRDPKTALQEWAQGRGVALPDYEEVARSGPPHAPQFTIRAALEGVGTAEASGSSKRTAERDAAAALLAQVERRTPPAPRRTTSQKGQE